MSADRILWPEGYRPDTTCDRPFALWRDPATGLGHLMFLHTATWRAHRDPDRGAMYRAFRIGADRSSHWPGEVRVCSADIIQDWQTLPSGDEVREATERALLPMAPDPVAEPAA